MKTGRVEEARSRVDSNGVGEIVPMMMTLVVLVIIFMMMVIEVAGSISSRNIISG